MFALLPLLAGGRKTHIRGGDLEPGNTCAICGEVCSDGHDTRSDEEKKVRPYYKDCVYVYWDINGTTHWKTYHKNSQNEYGNNPGGCGGLQAWFNQGRCEEPTTRINLRDWAALVPDMSCGEPLPTPARPRRGRSPSRRYSRPVDEAPVREFRPLSPGLESFLGVNPSYRQRLEREEAERRRRIARGEPEEEETGGGWLLPVAIFVMLISGL